MKDGDDKRDGERGREARKFHVLSELRKHNPHFSTHTLPRHAKVEGNYHQRVLHPSNSNVAHTVTTCTCPGKYMHYRKRRKGELQSLHLFNFSTTTECFGWFRISFDELWSAMTKNGDRVIMWFCLRTKETKVDLYIDIKYVFVCVYVCVCTHLKMKQI